MVQTIDQSVAFSTAVVVAACCTDAPTHLALAHGCACGKTSDTLLLTDSIAPLSVDTDPGIPRSMGFLNEPQKPLEESWLVSLERGLVGALPAVFEDTTDAAPPLH